MRLGMGCEAQTTAIAIARICNDADRPKPRPHTHEEIVNTFLGSDGRFGGVFWGLFGGERSQFSG